MALTISYLAFGVIIGMCSVSPLAVFPVNFILAAASGWYLGKAVVRADNADRMEGV
jgi:hypothetical protein